MNGQQKTKADWLTSVEWTAGTIGVVLVWWFLASDLLAQIAWIQPKIALAATLEAGARKLAWDLGNALQIVVTILMICCMVFLSVVIGGWFRRLVVVVRTTKRFRFVIMPLIAPVIGGSLVAAAEPMRHTFTNWPAGFNAFPAYLVIWALTLGYVLKLPWDCATELLAEESLGVRYAKISRRRSKQEIGDQGGSEAATEARDGHGS